MSDWEADARRSRQLTHKGQELYENTRDSYFSKLEKAWTVVETALNAELTEMSDKTIVDKKTKISYSYERYSTIFEEFKSYLCRQNTFESNQDLDSAQQLRNRKCELVNQTLSCLDALQKTIQECQKQLKAKLKSQASSRTPASSRSHSSASSRLSNHIARMKAKAQAARVSMEFAEKEYDLKKKCAQMEEEQKLVVARNNAIMERKRTELEAELSVLNHRKLVAAAEAECKVLAEETGFQDSPLTQENLEARERCDSTERTEHYVQDMHERVGMYSRTQVNKTEDLRLDPNSQPFVPIAKQTRGLHADTSHYNQENHASFATDLTRFLLKKDLLLSRLTCFNEKPESFCSWKASFLSIMRDLEVNPSEETDLLVKYLGPESSSYASSIRSANVNNPETGLKRLWERLDERYGSPELIDASLRRKIDNFPKLTNRDNKKLYELSDILSEIKSVKEDSRFSQSFAFYDSSAGILPIIRKLPQVIQDKWTSYAVKYKDQHKVSFPPFECFVEFIHQTSRIRNDPCFNFETYSNNTETTFRDTKYNKKNVNEYRTRINANKTQMKLNVKDTDFACQFHKTNKHSINDCRGFKTKPIDERRRFLKDNGLCFLCCMSSMHKKRNCTESITCSNCGSKTHSSALHDTSSLTPPRSHGGENSDTQTTKEHVSNKCTPICGSSFNGKSCSKTVLIKVYKKDNPISFLNAYAILDEQSNRSLASSELFSLLGIQGQPSDYQLTSCAGTVKSSGRRAFDIVVESLDGETVLELPTLVECELPRIRAEIPTPEVAQYHSHLSHIAHKIPPIDENAEILLLIGRDVPEAHHIKRQITGPKGPPYAQEVSFGWVVIGETCLKTFHPPDSVVVNKTFVLQNGRSSICKPCPNKFEIGEEMSHRKFDCDIDKTDFDCQSGIFIRTEYDDKVGPSVEDRIFLRTMDESVHKGDDGYWVAPLPFRHPRLRLPDNRNQVLRRTKSLVKSLQRDEVKKKHFLEFMDKVIQNKHAEVAPPVDEKAERGYIPIFGVYHPKKPNKVRVVFDSSAKFQNVSLNDVLISGPDMIISLVGVLLRFRKDLVGVVADIEQMFYCFAVSEEHRDFLRFFWFRDNDTSNNLIEYRMRVHVFGIVPPRPSQTIAYSRQLRPVQLFMAMMYLTL